ncbi:glycosyl hydrolase family 76 domain-containing protein [Trichoderma chlorosporum]
MKAAVVLAFLGASVGAVNVDFTSDASIKNGASTIAYGLMKYYNGNETGQVPGYLPQPYQWWEGGAMFEALIDYWARTGDSSYNEVTKQALLFQLGPNNDFMPANQSMSEANQVQGVWAMAAMTAAERGFPSPPKGTPQWQDIAVTVFNEFVERWDTANCGGGLREEIFSFNSGFDFKNSASNGVFFSLAARLYLQTRNSTYSEWATKIIEWEQKVNLITDSYQVLEGLFTENCNNITTAQDSWDGSIYLHGSAAMYKATGSSFWKTRVDGLLKGAQDTFVSDGVLVEAACESEGTCSTNLMAFKGYCVRYLKGTSQLAPYTASAIQPLLMASAKGAAKACSGSPSSGFAGEPGTACGFSWTGNAFDGSVGIGEQMNALSVVVSTLSSDADRQLGSRSGSGFNGTTTGTGSSKPSGTSGLGPTSVPPKSSGSRVAADVVAAAMVLGGIAYNLLSKVGMKMAAPHLICANWSPDSTDCKKFGNYTCKGCRLVVYCSSDCQKSHWKLHKVDCKSPLGDETWRPHWDLENRKPTFESEMEIMILTFSGNKCLWGNIPAIDVLQLGSNEGNDYEKQLNLLFAASGDLRNVIKTIAQVPVSYNKPIGVTINDNDFDVVARNAIILLTALVAENMDEAIDCIIHVWYSALIRKSDLDLLQQRVLPLVKSICEKTEGKDPSSLLGKTWKFGQRSLRLVLPKSSWDRLLAYMIVPEGLTAERASRIRMDVTLAEARKDFLDLHLCFQSPCRRIAKHRFRQDGLLLPFGAPRHEFQEPNPTLFQVTDIWPMADCADPLQGWSLKDVEDCSSGPATADIYGKLFNHIRAVLREFMIRLAGSQVSFKLLCVRLCELPIHLEGGSFDRIEVSNLSDNIFDGMHTTAFRMGPLLQAPLINPHATLITLFRNAIRETMTMQDRVMDMYTYRPATQLIREYNVRMGVTSATFIARYPPEVDHKVIKWAYAQANVAVYDPVFDRFMKTFRFSQIKQLFGVTMKEKHTVIEKWPFRLKLQYGQPGAMEELIRLTDEVVFAKERYVEWRRF